jgi:hypothetical protein
MVEIPQHSNPYTAVDASHERCEKKAAVHASIAQDVSSSFLVRCSKMESKDLKSSQRKWKDQKLS